VQVTDDERRVNLRNGAKIDVGVAAGVLDFLRGLAEHKPAHFQVLLDLARREPPPDHLSGVLAELRRGGFVTNDGSLRPVYRDVLLSAVREPGEGIVLASPFAPKDDAEAALIREHLAASEERLLRFARRLGYGRSEEGGGRGS
jgi:hypothetical protein